MRLLKGLLAAALAASLLPATAAATQGDGTRPLRIVAHPPYSTKSGYGRYGFLYWSGGEWRYGYGGPGFYRGRWNGGTIGPCWTWTPIGRVWNCGM